MRLPVLMYHNVSGNDDPDRLNISPEILELQFRFLSEKGFTAISAQDLLRYEPGRNPLPEKSVLITFDDGYRSQFTNAYPLLIKYNLKAIIFLSPGLLRTEKENSLSDYLHLDEVLSMKPDTVEFGFHGMEHDNYEEISLPAILRDIESLQYYFDLHHIPCQSCLAYPFGAFPRNNNERRMILFKIFERKGIRLAFRIGNRINKLPLKNKYLVQRIDIRGNDPLWKFKWMIRFGRKWLP